MKKIFTIAVLFAVNIATTRAQFTYPNDVCSGAMPLAVTNTSELSDIFYQDNIMADPALSPIPICSGSLTAKSDVWYSFIATDTAVSIVRKYYPAGATSEAYQLFSGDCNNLTSMGCYGGLNTTVGGLVIGQQYYLRSYHRSALALDPVTFNTNIISKPVNDNCAAAMLLPVYSAVTDGIKATRFTNDLATESGTECTATNPIAGMKDVWYKFIATGTTNVIYMQRTFGNAKAYVYQGMPGSLTQIAVFDFVSSSEVETLTSLVAGQTYYIRVGGTNISNFNISIYKDAPANDNCANADTVLMSTSFQCEKDFTVNNRMAATNSTGGCSSAAVKDVWYVFKATSAAVTVRATVSNSSLRLGLLQGSCGVLTCLANANGNAGLTYAGLVIGNYYYLQIGGSAEYETANICISPAITNDECSGAIALPVKPYNQLRNTIAYLGNATASSVTACTGLTGARDVWYKFTATDTACIITVDGGGYFQVLSGNCGSLASIHCSSGSLSVLETTEKVTGLAAGTVYYLRLSKPNAVPLDLFTIDVNTLPGNDECTGATILQPQQGLAYAKMENNGILQASQSLPPCSTSFATKDIWYKFTAAATTTAIISNTQYGGSSIGLEVYSGGCSSLSSIACIQQGAFKHKAQTLTNLTAGQTYYVRQYGSITDNTITIINPPANDDITGAARLYTSPSNVQPIPSYYTLGASKKFGSVCTPLNTGWNHDVWFYFIAEAASHTISTTTANSFWNEETPAYTPRVEAYRGFGADSAALASKLISCNSGSLSLSGLTLGDTVYICASIPPGGGIFTIKVSNTQNINEPAGALLLNATNGYQYSLSTTGATQSLPAAGCLVPDFPDDDIWFKFYAAADVKRVVAGFETQDITMQLFSGVPGSLTPLQCSNNIMVLPPLANGTLYYLRAYSKANAQPSTFRIGLFDEEELTANTCGVNTALLGANLIQNPRCETDHVYLLPLIPTNEGYAGKEIADGWWNVGNATADTWSADYPKGFGNVPDNGNGNYGYNKIPRSGKGMIGILNYSGWNEYVNAKLKQPLTKGKTYFVSFYVSFAEGYNTDALNIGAVFNNDSIYANLGTKALEITPDVGIVPGTRIDATYKWYNVCGYFYADKAYSYLTFGNFGNQLIYGTESSTEPTYFFLDDVLVAETSQAPLPLKLLDFSGRMNAQQQSELYWHTASETNTKYFEVEWRTDTKPFSKVGTVQAAGNSTIDKYYSFIHPSPEAGNNYYRLKMVDADGRFTYSPIVKTSLEKNNKLTVYPNPVSSSLNVRAEMEKDEMVYFKIIAADGRTVSSQYKLLKSGSNAFNWDVSSLAAGNYFIVSTSNALMPIEISKK